MAGQLNQTLVRQFRMPGYPLVLITTDLLQEGEDLHTFCSAIHHYGIAWTPSSMEQRIGRVDRVRSHTERRLLNGVQKWVDGKEMLQVYFPHLEDTVEVLQVQRVLERMNVFLRLMHEGLVTAGSETRTINTDKEFARGPRVVPQIVTKLETAFPITKELLRAPKKGLAAKPAVAKRIEARFDRLRAVPLEGLDIRWEPPAQAGHALGTVRLERRVQPFSLVLQSYGALPTVRCISPVGCVKPLEGQEEVLESARVHPVRIGAIVTAEERSYDLTVESDVILGEDPGVDRIRVAMLIARVVRQADLLEQQHLPGQDALLGQFGDDLKKEAISGR
jgi:hypothetical protein